MDERIFLYKAGQPIPEWDLRHRLPTDRAVGPECKDTATIFRINSTYMDVTDQPYMYKQMLAGGVLVLTVFSGGLMCVAQVAPSLADTDYSGIMIFFWLFIVSVITGFCYTAFKFGRDEFFSLKRRPIRFNRREQKIYTIRRRRFFAKPGEGDETWEVPWNAQSIFCMHRSDMASDNSYHIRHYTVDEQGNVMRAFAIGRQWEGRKNVQGLLSQWNYWCEYMNSGPADLPPPPLFFSEREDMRESFLFCMYEMGFTASSIFRIIMMPFILLFTSHRLMALWTCRDPVWPKTVEAVSAIVHGDTYDQPRGDTPVGWAETAIARARHEWPFDPKRQVKQWRGEPDAAKNALLWTEDTPPNAI
ncbi:hypothetical protein HSX11_20840 [Oxalobacteraceae bacterium]|nr:hypothetical protein [Oxalobacteraceae bacterium]